MKFFIILLFFYSSLLCENLPKEILQKDSDDNLFITKYEYGQMLYKNPRGIGCIKCHGKNGTGNFIARYIHKKKKFELHAPAINNIPLDKFRKTLKRSSTSKNIMPTYFLTNDEIKSIHFYIINKKDL